MWDSSHCRIPERIKVRVLGATEYRRKKGGHLPARLHDPSSLTSADFLSKTYSAESSGFRHASYSQSLGRDTGGSSSLKFAYCMVGFHKPLSPYWLPGFWKLGFYPIPQVGDWKILFRGNWPKRKDQKIWIFGVSSNGRSGPHHAIGWPMVGRPCPWHSDHSVRGYVPHSGKPSTVIVLQLGLSLSPNKQLHCYWGIFANIIFAFLDLLITKALVLISLKILASPFTKLASLSLCISIAPLPPSLPKLRLVFFFFHSDID